MTEKTESVPLTKDHLARPDFQERIQGAIARSRAAGVAETQDAVAAGWRYVLVIGNVHEIRMREADHFEILMQGWDDYENIYEGEVRRWFRFRTPQDDLLAEARRSQSDGLGFEFQCYLTDATEPLRKSPLLVQQVKYHSVWGTQIVRVNLWGQMVRVDVTNQLLPVAVKEPNITGNGLYSGGPPIAVSIMPWEI